MNKGVVKTIHEEFKTLANVKSKEAFNKFVPTAQIIYGVRMPDMNLLAKKYKEGGFELIDILWQNGSFEDRVLAAKILALIANKNKDETLKWIKNNSHEITDWVVCDTIGMQCSKPLAKTHKKELFNLSNSLILSDYLWERRIALVLIECFTKYPEDHAQIIKLVNIVDKDKEYYVKKAVQWINRNLKKVNK